jgi:hypothetical protein
MLALRQTMFYTLFRAIIWLFGTMASRTRVWHARNTIIDLLAPATIAKVLIFYVVWGSAKIFEKVVLSSMCRIPPRPIAAMLS